MPPSRKYSDPDAISRITDLALRSRRLVEGAISGQFPSWSGWSIPSHISCVEPLRPEWPSCAPIATPPPWACANSTIRRHAAVCSSL